MITFDSLHFLQSGAGAALLDELRQTDLAESHTLKLLTALRKRFPAEHAAAALETARLRLRAQEKFGPPAAQMFFTREALEQSTPAAVSQIHRSLLAEYSHIADLGCGIGADTLAFAETSAVLAVDRDPLRLALLRANAPAWPAPVWPAAKYPVQTVQADLTQSLPMAGLRAAFFDPARRTEGRRAFSIHDYSPPLEIVYEWPFEALLVKLSPGVDRAELAPFGGTLDFVSWQGELKEALLRLGGLAAGGNRAIVLGQTPCILDPTGAEAPPLRPPQGYLYEPDPAVIRAGLLGELVERLALPMYRLDETIAYLTADSPIESPLARVWQIEDWLPFNLKRLRAYLRERGVGQVTVKKRGSPITPEELIAQLKLPTGSESRVIVLTHVTGQHAALICLERK